MKTRVVATVPGKLILMGEHAAVYGQPALVAAADPGARVEIAREAKGLKVDLLDLDRTFQTTWLEARTLAERCRAAWQRYASAPTPGRFAEVGPGTPDSLTRLALGELAIAMSDRPLPGLSIRISSSLPIGSGFGSSASIAVALVGGILALVEDGANPNLVDDLALEVERRQHGLPSGVDHRTVLYGGVVLAERRADGQMTLSKLGQRSAVLEGLQVYQTGQPAESTGEVVAAVRRRRDEDPETVDGLMARMGDLVRGFGDALTQAPEPAPRVLELIRDYQSCLQALGVVPTDVHETIQEVEIEGGAAKISGAGSLTGSSAGCLLVYWPDGPPAKLPARLSDQQRLAVELGVEGLRVEEES